MAYTKTTWTNDTGEPIDADNLNKIEQGIFDTDAAATAASSAASSAASAASAAQTDANAALLGKIVNVLTHGADETGATSSNTAFTAAMAAGGSVYVPPGTYNLDSNITLSGHFIFSEGASIDADAVVTITASVTAGRYQIASHGTGTVVWETPDEILIEWIGVLQSNTAAANKTNWENFIKAQSYDYDYKVTLGRGSYPFAAPLNLPQRMILEGHKMFSTQVELSGVNVHGIQTCYISSATITTDSSMVSSCVYSGLRGIEFRCNDMTFTNNNKRFIAYMAALSSGVIEDCRFNSPTDQVNQMDGLYLGPTYADASGAYHHAALRCVIQRNRITNVRDGIVIGRHNSAKVNHEPASGGNNADYVGGDVYENTIGPRNYIQASLNESTAMARYGIISHFYSETGGTVPTAREKPYANTIYNNSCNATSGIPEISITVSASTTFTGTGFDAFFPTDGFSLPFDYTSGVRRYVIIHFNDGTNDYSLYVESVDSATQGTFETAFSGTPGTYTAQMFTGVGLLCSSEGKNNLAFGNFFDTFANGVRLTGNADGWELFGNHAGGTSETEFLCVDNSDDGNFNYVRFTNPNKEAVYPQNTNKMATWGIKRGANLDITSNIGYPTVSYHPVDNSAGAVTINGMVPMFDGQFVTVRPTNTSGVGSAGTVTIVDGAGVDYRFNLSSNVVLSAQEDTATFMFDASLTSPGRWLLIGTNM